MMADNAFYRGRTYKKDKKVSLMKVESIRDDSGFWEEKTVPLPGGENIWAYYRHASADEFYAAASNNINVEAIFKVNWRDDIDYNIKVKYNGNMHDVTRIDDFEGYKKDITLYAHVINPE